MTEVFFFFFGFFLLEKGYFGHFEKGRVLNDCFNPLVHKKLQQFPHVSEARGGGGGGGSANPNPKPWAWAFNSVWSRSLYVAAAGNSTPPVNDSRFLTFTLTSTPPSSQSPVRPKKSLVRLSLFCHVAIFPDVKPRWYSGDMVDATWPTVCEPTVAAFWRSAVAER